MKLSRYESAGQWIQLGTFALESQIWNPLSDFAPLYINKPSQGRIGGSACFLWEWPSVSCRNARELKLKARNRGPVCKTGLRVIEKF